MKIGKVSENVLKRSVIRQLHSRREEVLMGAGVGEDCAAVQLAPDEIMVLSTDPITGAVHEIGKLAILITVNDLASAGAEPVGVMLTVLLPEKFMEPDLKQLMQELEAAAGEASVQIMGGHTEVTKAVTQPLVSVCGVGKVKKGRLISTGGAHPGMDILVTKWIGIEGTAILAREKEEELKARFSPDFLRQAQEFDRWLSVVRDAAIAVENEVAAMHDVTEGGIFGALWELAEASGVGLEIDLKKIPIRQETVEICEFFHINPYRLISSGCMLMAAADGNRLVAELKKAGIEATVIGKATDSNDRVLFHEDERRFLEQPQTDELYKVV
ncbi:MAG: AIR synthase family protein [Lachnospiraceae bacterium]|nr:AIR synthase family protein [Lachnospiraceae bacterium]